MTNAWGVVYTQNASCQIAEHARKGTPLIKYKDICSEDLRHKCHYAEIELVMFLTSKPSFFGTFSPYGREEVWVMVKGEKMRTTNIELKPNPFDDFLEERGDIEWHERTPDQYYFSVFDDSFYITDESKKGFRLQKGRDATYRCLYVSEEQGADNILDLILEE